MNKTQRSRMLIWNTVFLIILSICFPFYWIRWGVSNFSAAPTPEEAAIKYLGKSATVRECLNANNLAWIRYGQRGGQNELFAKYDESDQMWKIIPKELMKKVRWKIGNSSALVYRLGDSAMICYRQKGSDSLGSKFFFADYAASSHWWVFLDEVPSIYLLEIDGIVYEFDFLLGEPR